MGELINYFSVPHIFAIFLAKVMNLWDQSEDSFLSKLDSLKDGSSEEISFDEKIFSKYREEILALVIELD